MGAAQYAVEKLNAKKIVVITGDTPATVPYVTAGVEEYAKSVNVPYAGLTASVAAQIVTAAGDGGAAVLVFPEPFDSAVMKAAEAAGISDKVIWTCATPCRNSRMASACIT